MKHILIFGAGKSSVVLCRTLAERAIEKDWMVHIADKQSSLMSFLRQHPDRLVFHTLDVMDHDARHDLVRQADVVISLMPPALHVLIAESCLLHHKHLLTASYVSDAMQALDELARQKGLLFLNELGVDPGIDHMSAMAMIHDLKNEGAEITDFESFTGGLLAPESEKDNPWQYKFTWNPKNVVTAGQGTVKFLQEGKFKFIPYHRLFRRTEIIHIPGHGYFEGYANRDSLKYRDLYQLHEARTIYRGTLRRVGYCRAWDTFVQLGATDDTYVMPNAASMTKREFINSFLYYNPHDTVELKLAHYMKFDVDGEEMHKLRWLGIFRDEPCGIDGGTPAAILQKILEEKWTMTPQDRDMIVMWHKVRYQLQGKSYEKHAYMVVEGKDSIETAMAKTVGLPLAVACELVLQGVFQEHGVLIPVMPSLYQPILKRLALYDIKFEHREVDPML